MTRLLAALALLACLIGFGPAEARPVNVPSGNPLLGIDIPAGWTTKPTARGIEVRSPDEEVFFWVEVYLPADHDALVKEHETYFAKQGVAITGQPRTERNVEDGVTVQATNFPATWKGKPTILRYLAIDPDLPAKNQVLLSYWASPEGDRTHDAAFGAILKSLGAPK